MSAPRLCKASRARKVVIITAIVITLINLNTFFTYEYVKDEGTGKLMFTQYPRKNPRSGFPKL
jgi:hypothetical protein